MVVATKKAMALLLFDDEWKSLGSLPPCRKAMVQVRFAPSPFLNRLSFSPTFKKNLKNLKLMFLGYSICGLFNSPSLNTMKKYKRIGNEAPVPWEYDLQE